MNSFIRLEHFGELSDSPDFYLRKDTIIMLQRQYDDVFTVKTTFNEEYLCRFCFTNWDEDGKEIKEIESDETTILNMIMR